MSFRERNSRSLSHPPLSHPPLSHPPLLPPPPLCDTLPPITDLCNGHPLENPQAGACIQSPRVAFFLFVSFRMVPAIFACRYQLTYSKHCMFLPWNISTHPQPITYFSIPPMAGELGELYGGKRFSKGGGENCGAVMALETFLF